ncbi:MAG: adenylate/guanylate cyclase domain-containing protein [Elusimicrobiota bacterium]|nr:adenylate/guanylate cyclase domain-containing protein [Elusimicrobiota bacterium]
MPKRPLGRPRLDKTARWAVPACVLAGLLALRVSGWGWVEGVQHRAFDAFLNIRPRPYVDAGVRVVDIDEETLGRYGQWPWPRTLVATLITRLLERGAAVVAFDVVFPEDDRTSPDKVISSWPDEGELKEVKSRLARMTAFNHDARLARRLKGWPVVLGFAPVGERTPRLPEQKASYAFSFAFSKTKDAAGVSDFGLEYDNPRLYVSDQKGATSNITRLDAAVSGLGSIGFLPEHDGLIRRAPLFTRLQDNLYPSLALEALRVAQDATGFAVKIGGTSGETWLQRLLDRQTGITKVKVGKMVVPTDGAGRLWVYYTRERAPRSLPAWKVLDPKASIAGLEGAVVFIGTSAQGLRDLRATPLDPSLDGVQVHANLAEQMLLGEYLQRPGRADKLEVLFTALAALLLIGLLARLGAAWAAPVGVGMTAAAVWASWHAYTTWHWLLDPVFPVATLAAVFASFVATGYVMSEKDRRRITDTFGRYLSPKVVAKLADKPGAVELGGETREMTFHFCDIRGFTTISEKFDPHGLTDFINKFLTPMTQIILDHDGTIDKYMGDCIMAFWNAPMDVPDHARKACAAALAMHARLKELNDAWQAEAKAAGRDLPLIEIGTGLNTGPCVVGNMGSTLRVDYTVLGDDVNLASRLEGQSKGYGVKVVIGPRTRQQAPEFAAIELDLIKVKGKTEAVRIFALLGSPEEARSEAFQALAAAHEAMLAAYRAQKWDEATAALARVAGLGKPWRLDKLVHLYEERIAHFKATPPGADWDGVFVATSK